MDFINREKEIEFLNSYFKYEPNSMLFIYGPKSSGKSSLLEKVATNLDFEKYAVNFLDLRQVIIYDFKTFLDVFFQEDLQEKTKDILSGLTINAGFFNIKLSNKSMLKKNAFKVITDQLVSARKRGIQPVIIIDEIQLLKPIYINGERHLIDELFNLFIALTKVRHLAHVVLATSDSYFINDIYNSAKLSKTSRFFLLDHFDEETVRYWLEKEKFDNNEIDTVYSKIGGSPWEITEIIGEKKEGKKVEAITLEIINDHYEKIVNFRLDMQDKKLRKQFDLIVKDIVEKGGYIRHDEEDTALVKALLKRCIELDIWFYRASEHKIIANSRSIFLAFEKMTKQKVG